MSASALMKIYLLMAEGKGILQSLHLTLFFIEGLFLLLNGNTSLGLFLKCWKFKPFL